MQTQKICCLIVLMFVFAHTAAAQKSVQVDVLLAEFYNRFNSTSSNQEVKEKIEQIIREYPDDPYLYSFWASVEWILIGHELGISVGDRQNLSSDKNWSNRLTTYVSMINQGLALTEGKTDTHSLLARAELLFERSKLQYRFWGDLRGADRTTAELIRFLRSGTSCHNYYFWGSSRFGISTQSKWKQAGIYFLSKAYEALYELDNNVYNTEQSIEWLERAYRCGYPDIAHKKLWIETAFFLANAYETYRRGLAIEQELVVLKKQIDIERILTMMFPENEDFAQHYKLITIRQTILENFLAQKKSSQ